MMVQMEAVDEVLKMSLDQGNYPLSALRTPLQKSLL